MNCAYEAFQKHPQHIHKFICLYFHFPALIIYVYLNYIYAYNFTKIRFASGTINFFILLMQQYFLFH